MDYHSITLKINFKWEYIMNIKNRDSKLANRAKTKRSYKGRASDQVKNQREGTKMARREAVRYNLTSDVIIGNMKGSVHNLSDDKANPMTVIILDNGKIITSERN